MTALRRAVFLDRDGVLNAAVVKAGRPHPPATAADVVVLPGVPEACARLAEAGWVLVVVTNQPDVARGLTTMAEVDAINDRVTADLPIERVVVCPHDETDGCGCRKPRPGMVLEASAALGLDPAASVLVGDRWRDVAAGQSAGARTVFIDRGYDERRPDAPDHIAVSLDDAATWILALG